MTVLACSRSAAARITRLAWPSATVWPLVMRCVVRNPPRPPVAALSQAFRTAAMMPPVSPPAWSSAERWRGKCERNAARTAGTLAAAYSSLSKWGTPTSKSTLPTPMIWRSSSSLIT